MTPDRYISYFRKDIDRMDGYAPGEQLNIPELIKLNTNENPFPPCPGVFQALSSIDPERLRLYPLLDRPGTPPPVPESDL